MLCLLAIISSCLLVRRRSDCNKIYWSISSSMAISNYLSASGEKSVSSYAMLSLNWQKYSRQKRIFQLSKWPIEVTYCAFLAILKAGLRNSVSLCSSTTVQTLIDFSATFICILSNSLLKKKFPYLHECSSSAKNVSKLSLNSNWELI